MNFLSKSSDEEPAQPKCFKKKARLASRDWLLRTDKQLQSILGRGLSFWCRSELPEDADGHVHEQAGPNEALGIHADRGPDGSCAAYYLVNELKASVVLFWDFNHDAHNDLVNAMRSTADIYDRMVLNGVAYNVHWGPWSSMAWFRACAEAAGNFAKLATLDDPLYQAMLPQLLHSSGAEEMHYDPEFIQNLFDTNFQQEIFTKMGPKLQFSRYHSIIDVSEWWLPRWGGRLSVLIFMGLAMGWLKKSSGHLAPILSRSQVRKDSEKQRSSSSTKGSAAPTNILREKCHNQLHAATIIMLDPQQRSTAQLVVSMSQMVRKWVGQKNSRVRTAANAAQFYEQMAGGEWLDALSKTLMLFEDRSVLNDLGFTITPTAAVLSSAADDPIVLSEVEHAKLVAQYAFELLRRRFTRGVAHTWGFPLAFAAFLGNDDSQRDRVLALMKETDEAWDKAVTMTDPLIKKVVRRSSMNHAVVKTMFDYARGNGFSSVSADMMALCRNMFCTAFGQTKVCEDALKPCRAAEEHEQSSKTMRAERVYWQPVKHKILSELHHFSEVAPTDILPAPSDPSRLPRSQYTSSRSGASTKALEAVAGQGAPSWPTFSAMSASAMECDLALVRHLNMHKKWSYAGLSWYSVLLNSGILVRNRKLHRTNQWFLSLGHSIGLAAYAWPVRRIELSKNVFCFKPLAKPPMDGEVFLVVTDPAEWEAYPGSISPPVQNMLRKTTGKKQDLDVVELSIIGEGPPKPLLQVCAQNCFFDLPQICIKELCKTLGANDYGDSLLTMLKSLIKHCAPKTTEVEMLDILSQRLKGRTQNLGEFFEDEALLEVFDISDHSVLTEYIKDGAKVADSAKIYQEGVHEYRKTVRGLGLKKGRKYPPAFPSAITLSAAMEVIPHGAKLAKDTNENRWRGCLSPFGTISRSWLLHGEGEALKLVARQLWMWHERASGERCPIQGIFE